MLTARYGNHMCELRVSMSDNNAEIGFRVRGKQTESLCIRGGFTMQLKPGGRLKWSTNRKGTVIDPLSRLFVEWSGRDEERTVSTGSWTLAMAPGSSLEWPVYPFNPYAINDSAPPEQAVAAVSVPLKPSRSFTRFFLTVR